MKKTISTIVALATIASIVSCKKEMSSKSSDALTVNFSTSIADSKAVVGDLDGNVYHSHWTTNDTKFGFSHNYKSPSDINVTVAEDLSTASFSMSVTPSETSNEFCVVSPTAAFIGASTTNKMQFEVVSSQTPLSSSVDEAALILYGYKSTGATVPESMDMSMKHFTSYCKFSFTNLAADPETITSISVTADADIAGRFYFNPTDGTVTVNSGKKSITLATTETEDLWMAVAPAHVTSLTFTVTTTAGNYEKTVSSLDKDFVSGHIATFTVNMSGITPKAQKKYYLLTDVSDLEEGIEVVIAAADYAKAISTTQNSNNRAETSVDKSEDKSYLTAGASVELFTLEEGSVADTWSFKTSTGGYIYAANSNSNQLKTQSTKDANGSWAISISSGVLSVVAQGTNTRNCLQYNDGSSIFNCYSSASQKAVAIYYAEGKTKLATPADLAVNSDTKTVSWSAVTGAKDYTVTVGTKTSTVTSTSYTHDEEGYFDVKVIANPSDKDNYRVSDAAILKDQKFGNPATITGISGIKGATEGVSFAATLTDAIVTAVATQSTNTIGYLQDADAAIYLYFATGSTPLKVGDKINGSVKAKTKTYNGVKEIIEFDFSEATVTPDATLPLETITVAELNANYSNYEYCRIEFEGVTFTDGMSGTSDKNGVIKQGEDNTCKTYATRGNVTVATNAQGNMIGFPTYYNDNKQISVWSQDDVTVLVPNTITMDATKSMKVGDDAWTIGATCLEGEVSYTIVSGGDYITLSNGQVTPVAAGTAVVKATSPASGNYLASEATCTITVKSSSTSSATYKVLSTSSVETSGTAPASSSVTYSSTYSTKEQLTSGNSMTLTLSGYTGKKIVGITLYMHSNSSKGAGTFSATAGTTSLASISSATNFDKWYDNKSFGSNYRDVKVTMSNDSYIIKDKEDVEIVIAATVNSLYCQSFTIEYE